MGQFFPGGGGEFHKDSAAMIVLGRGTAVSGLVLPPAWTVPLSIGGAARSFSSVCLERHLQRRPARSRRHQVGCLLCCQRDDAGLSQDVVSLVGRSGQARACVTDRFAAPRATARKRTSRGRGCSSPWATRTHAATAALLVPFFMAVICGPPRRRCFGAVSLGRSNIVGICFRVRKQVFWEKGTA